MEKQNNLTIKLLSRYSSVLFVDIDRIFNSEDSINDFVLKLSDQRVGVVGFSDELNGDYGKIKFKKNRKPKILQIMWSLYEKRDEDMCSLYEKRDEDMCSLYEKRIENSDRRIGVSDWLDIDIDRMTIIGFIPEFLQENKEVSILFDQYRSCDDSPDPVIIQKATVL